MERVMRNLTALPAFSASCFRAAASYSELLATKRRDCLGTDNWEHLQLAELINLYKCCYFMRCFSQSWSNSMPYWFNTLLYGSPDLSVTPAVINACLAHCFCVFLGKLDTEDWWHYVTGPMSPSWKSVHPAEVREQTGLFGSLSPGRHRGYQPLCQSPSATQFTVSLQISGLWQEKS